MDNVRFSGMVPVVQPDADDFSDFGVEKHCFRQINDKLSLKPIYRLLERVYSNSWISCLPYSTAVPSICSGAGFPGNEFSSYPVIA